MKDQIITQTKEKQTSLYPKELPELQTKVNRLVKPFNKDELFQK